MNEVFQYLKNYLKEDFKWGTYLYFFLFLTVTISFNYIYDFEDSILDSYNRTYLSFVFYTLFYAVAYYGVAIPQLLFVKKGYLLRRISYWGRSFVFIAIAGFSSYFYWHKTLVFSAITSSEVFLVRKILAQFSSFFDTALPLFLFWLIIDKAQGYFYGLRFRNAKLKPYFYMLLIMFPLIFWASFQSDFQANYPVFKPWKTVESFGLNKLEQSVLFEFAYLFSFCCVELLFRGALVIGMSKLVGKDVILPMVAMYAFLHFGKPLGETIGSVFGGYILGVIALRKNHILGGIMIHMGVAFLMEITALYQFYF